MRALLPTLLLLPLAACSTGDFGSVGQGSHSGNSANPPYHAYGDSITFGTGLASPGTDDYAVLLANQKTRYLTNQALGGDQACDVLTRQIFPAADSPSTATPTLYTLLISTNDIDVKGVGPYQAVFNLCHQSALAWLATSKESKIFPAAAAITGPTHTDTTSGFNALTTDAAGATLTFSFTRATPGPLYLWYKVTDGNAGTFTYSIDKTTPAALNSTTSPLIATANGSNTAVALLRIPSLTTGAHTIVLTQTSTGTSGVGLIALGVPPSTRPAGSPRVLVGTTPLQLTPSGVPCGGTITPSPCTTFSADITANAQLLAADGLDIELFQTAKYMTGTTADLTDYVHPNVAGHLEILHSITDIY